MSSLARLLAGIDRFLILLIATVILASIWPPQGIGITVFEWATNFAITLLFFLHGAKLSREAILGGIGKWQLHLLVLSFSFILFPLLGLGLTAGLNGVVSATVLPGILFLTLLPSTVQASIAFTSIAGGNVPAAVCSASLSNILGIVLTPVLVGLLMHVGNGTHGVSLGAIRDVMLQLLLPFLVGHLARPLIGSFIHRNKNILMPVDRGAILMVVYSAFGAAVRNGIWQRTDAIDLVWMLLSGAALLAAVMVANRFVARRFGLSREDEIVLFFCGSKKSLVSGVPIAGTLFPAAQVGVIILPLMIFHQLQLFVCAVIAARYQQQRKAAES